VKRDAYINSSIKIVAVILICLGYGCTSAGQSAGSSCQSFEKASTIDLTNYLHGIVPNENNQDCITVAIRRLGEERYELAIPELVNLLDFRRPLTQQEEEGFFSHLPTVEGMFPAAQALELIGKNALPGLARALRSESTSDTSRENAVAVWMMNYKFEHAKGILSLKQEETSTNDSASKQRLRAALSNAVDKWCRQNEKEACRSAANSATP
jgi:hypothetical protein